jgi:hypothetical protein
MGEVAGVLLVLAVVGAALVRAVGRGWDKAEIRPGPTVVDLTGRRRPL